MARQLSPERRERFLSAALKLFVENGVQQTSTAAIAKEAGSAAGTLFIYFPTKQDLIDELVLQVVREQAKNTQAALRPDFSAWEAFYAIWNSTVRWFLADMASFLYIQQVRDSGAIPDEVAQETEKQFVYYYEAIQKGLEEGSIKPYPIELIGNYLYYAIVAVMNLIQNQPDPDKREEFIESGFAIFWDGIKTEAV
jgi:AcrR family transcriptional regulator